MRISKDIKKSVVFLGHGDSGTFTPSGTGFFLSFEGAQYLVTVKHVAKELGNDPFAVRMNQLDGGVGVLHFDPEIDSEKHPWFTHEDETVDLAVMPINVEFYGGGFDRLLVPDMMLGWKDAEIGLGDVCYAVGLFARFSGKTRNVPVVHVGHIASFGDGERIPVRDRSNPTKTTEIEMEGYLVELANLPGLSGAPVFARPTVAVDFHKLLDSRERDKAFDLPSTRLVLLGIWSGSWDGYADDPAWRSMSVPVGMGFVIPSAKLSELLMSAEVVAERGKYLEELRAREIAQQDAPPA